MKPILRKFTQSEKNSLDLDRPAVEQDGLGIYDFGNGSRSAHDVAFVHTSRRTYHNRSTSGTSQFSTATSGSNHRAGSFVHPFQQTPRPYTPPLGGSSSYQNSLRESEQSIHSPALAEDEEQHDQPQVHLRNNSSLANQNNTNNTNRAPSLTSATTPSNLNTPPLRLQTKHAISSSRLARASHTSLSSTLILSPDFASPTDTMSPASAIRSSFDRGFRIRSRSDIVQTQTVEEARREFNARERAKDEKAAQEEVEALNKRNKREAKRQIGGEHRRSSASEATRSKRSKSDLTIQHEKGVFGHEYGSAPMDVPPAMEGEGFEEPKRSRTTSSAHNFKKKSNGTFHAVVMWIRTRILRLKRKTSSY